jgi:hypothetical protein
MTDRLIDTLQNKEYSELKDNIEKVVAKKVVARVAAKRDAVLSKLNGIAVEPTDDSTGEK